MNTLVNTPLLNSAALKENFDNKTLLIFLILISTLIILGMIFVDLTNIFSKPVPTDNNPSEDSQQTQIYT